MSWKMTTCVEILFASSIQINKGMVFRYICLSRSPHHALDFKNIYKETTSYSNLIETHILEGAFGIK